MRISPAFPVSPGTAGGVTTDVSAPSSTPPHSPSDTPRESERPIFQDRGPSPTTDHQLQEFLTILADSVTLTIQAAAEQLAAELARDASGRERIDRHLDAVQTLIEDRRAVLDGFDGITSVARAVLERHGWLAVQEARLNVRDAPEWWPRERLLVIAAAAEHGAAWLEQIGIADPRRPSWWGDAL